MSNRIRACKALVCLLSVLLAFVVFAGVNRGDAVYKKTVNVSNEEEFQAALDDAEVDHIVITRGFSVDCPTAEVRNTSYFVIDRSMTIEGTSSDIKIIRKAADGASNGYLQSLFGIDGNPKEGEVTEGEGRRVVEVNLRNLTLDGGAVYGNYEGYGRCEKYNEIKNLGAAGRSLVDVFGYGILNLENGLTIQNSYCTYSLASCINDSGSWCFGGAVRVDFDADTGGGTVNVKTGSCIKDCVASNANGRSYGGALGAYTFARLNVYGGTIKDCSAFYGGAVGCTYRSKNARPECAGTFRMYGGLIEHCSAHDGGAICVQGENPDPNCLYGGTINNCTAVEYGGSVKLSGDNDKVPPFSITPYSVNGPLFITNCTSGYPDTDPESFEGGDQISGYSGLSLGQDGSTTKIEGTAYTVTFKKYMDDTDNYAVLTVKEGQSLGESFPADPTDEQHHYTFVGWNLAPDGSEDNVDKDYAISKNITVYARWLRSAEFTYSSDTTLTYGDLDQKLEVFDAKSPYGGQISYQWYIYDSPTSISKIEGETSSTYQIPKKDAGSYTYCCYVTNTIEGFPSHVDSTKKIIVTVEPMTVKINWSDLEFTYDGKAKLPKAEVEGILDGDDVSVEVTGEKKAVGTYTATAKLVGEDAGNYVIGKDSATKKFSIKSPSIKLNKTSASVSCGESVSLKATLNVESSAISWKSSDSKVATVDKNGKVTTKMAGTATITASALGVSAECKVTVLYKDVTNTSDFWYAPTNYLTAKGVVKGYANQTEFRPANDCTRAQMITFLYRLQGEPKTKSTTCKFTDVKSTEYFYKPVIWAVEQGITTVPSDKKFNPQTVCTRAMTVTFLWRMAGKPEPKTTKNPFPDVKKTDYFYKATLWASEMKILAGLPDGTFQPQGKCLRRQMVTFLYKYDKYVNGKG